MNLNVDLILPSEQRSSSPVGFQLIGKLLLLVAACFIGGYTGLKVMAITDLRNQMRGAEAAWMKVSPRQKQAMQLIKEATENISILDEINGWETSRPLWHEHLQAVAMAVPEQIQIESLSVQHEFLAPKSESTVRSFSLALNGRCSREHAEVAVQTFQQNIQQVPPLSELVEGVEVPRFGEDPKMKEDRLFQITCACKPLKML